MNINSSISAVEPTQGVRVPGIKPAQVQIQTQQEGVERAVSQKRTKGEQLAELQTVLTQHNISMNFSRDERTNQVVVRLMDDRTGEAIRQIPNEVSLKLTAANIKLQGQIVDETV